MLSSATGLLSDRQLRMLCQPPRGDDPSYQPMIWPFMPAQIREVCNLVTQSTEDLTGTVPTTPRKVLSYGPAPFGYDVTLSEDIRLFSNINSVIADPKAFDDRCLVHADVKKDHDGSKYVLLPPNSYLLGRTAESFCLPNNITALVLGKSSYARVGVIINATIIQAGFKADTLVIEIANATTLPVKIYLHEGIATCLFFAAAESAETPYAGQYQGQNDIRLPGRATHRSEIEST